MSFTDYVMAMDRTQRLEFLSRAGVAESYWYNLHSGVKRAGRKTLARFTQATDGQFSSAQVRDYFFEVERKVTRRKLEKVMRSRWLDRNEAFDLVDCLDLTEVINEMRSEGVLIHERWRDTPDGGRFCQYRIVGDV